MNQKLDPIVFAFNQVLKKLCQTCTAQDAYELLHSFTWDADKYIGDDNYKNLRAKYQENPQKLLLIDFMETHLSKKPFEGINGLSKLIDKLALTDAATLSARVGLAR